MNFIGLTVLVLLKMLEIENRMLYDYETVDPTLEIKSAIQLESDIEPVEDENEKVIGLRTFDDKGEEYENEQRSKKPCAIVVLSSVQSPSMQSLLRRYRYNSHGILIPNSVKYFIKLSQGLRDTPILVPLNNKAFSPLGGFVRYYKEVPPIPHSWLN